MTVSGCFRLTRWCLPTRRASKSIASSLGNDTLFRRLITTAYSCSNRGCRRTPTELVVTATEGERGAQRVRETNTHLALRALVAVRRAAKALLDERLRGELEVLERREARGLERHHPDEVAAARTTRIDHVAHDSGDDGGGVDAVVGHIDHHQPFTVLRGECTARASGPDGRARATCSMIAASHQKAAGDAAPFAFRQRDRLLPGGVGHSQRAMPDIPRRAAHRIKSCMDAEPPSRATASSTTGKSRSEYCETGRPLLGDSTLNDHERASSPR